MHIFNVKKKLFFIIEDKMKEGSEGISVREQKHLCFCKILASSMLDEEKPLNTVHNNTAGYTKVITIISSREQVLPSLMRTACCFKRDQFSLEV